MTALASEPGPWVLVLLTVLAAGLLCGALAWILRRREQWMIACLLLSLSYVALSLGLEGSQPSLYLEALRWGLLAAALFSFARYRWGSKGRGGPTGP